MQKLFLYVCLSLLFLNCNDDNDFDSIDCTKVICTTDIRALSVSIEDQSGVVVPLDSLTLTKKEDGKDITPEYTAEEFKVYRQNGNYPIFSDLSPENQRNTQISVLFRGFINAEEVVRADFVIGSDCCHVSFIEGNNNLIIN